VFRVESKQRWKEDGIVARTAYFACQAARGCGKGGRGREAADDQRLKDGTPLADAEEAAEKKVPLTMED